MLRIAFDLDGTIADLDAALAQIAERLFGREPEGAPPDAAAPSTAVGGDEGPSPEEEEVTPARVRALTPRQQQAIWDVARRTGNFWESLPEIEPGAVARIASIARDRRWEVIFLTQRPSSAGDTTQRQSQRWLAAHGFDLPSVFVISGSRGSVAASLDLDIVVDDRPENCLDVKVDSRARAVLVTRTGNANIPENAGRMGIETVGSIGELLDRLEAAESAEGGSILDRLKRMIGRSS